jgi:hypothetical protein
MLLKRQNVLCYVVKEKKKYERFKISGWVRRRMVNINPIDSVSAYLAAKLMMVEKFQIMVERLSLHTNLI